MYYFKEIEKYIYIPKIEQELTIPYEFEKKKTNSRECIPRSILQAKNSYLE